MTRIDLDAVAARYEQAQQHRYLVHLPQIADVVACATDVPALVAELRAARAVIRVGRSHVRAEALDSSMGAATWSDLRDALAAYDQAVGR